MLASESQPRPRRNMLAGVLVNHGRDMIERTDAGTDDSCGIADIDYGREAEL